MTQYPYLDLAVMADIRELVISPCAALVIDRNLSSIIWANGEGAALLGTSQINELLDVDLRDHSVMRRQIVSAVARLQDTGSINASIRIARGWKTRLVNFQVSNFTLPDGESAILLVTEKLLGRFTEFEEMAEATISCLNGSGYVSVILDKQGGIVSASDGYAETGVDPRLHQSLIREVATESDRLVKRMVDTDSGEMAAGIARLSDDPAVHLLILAASSDAGEIKHEMKRAETDHLDANAPANNAANTGSIADKDEPPVKAGAFSSRRPSMHDGDGGVGMARWYYRQPNIKADDKISGVASDQGIETTDNDPTIEQSKPDLANHDVIDLHKQKTVPPVDLPLFSKRQPAEIDPNETSVVGKDEFEFIAKVQPTRFVWHMDKEHKFTSISLEFSKIVGPLAANVVGSKWEDIARSFSFDEDGAINDRLARGDTWSGKTVLWPVQGTSLRVPVDLAGLPSFNQDKEFSGYHGFGTIRTVDTVDDALETGLELVGRPSPDAQPPFEIAGEIAGEIAEEIAGEPDEETATPFTSGTDDEQAELASEISLSEEKPESANVVNLTEQRQARAGRELSSGEKAAFSQIADKLHENIFVETAEKETVVPKNQAQKFQPDRPAESNDNNSDAVTSFLPSAFAGISSENHHRIDTSILVNLPIPVLIFRENLLLFTNQEFARLTGYEDNQALIDDGGVEALLGAPDGQSEGYTTITHQNGDVISVRAHLQSVPWDGNRALLLALREADTILDDRSSVENKDLALDGVSANRPSGFKDISNQELSSILDTATDGVLVLSSKGTIRSINRAAEALFGYEDDAVTGKNFTTLFAKESHRSANDYLAGLSNNGVASLLNDGRELIGREMQGGLIPLFVTLGRLEESDSYCAVLRDITQWKKAEEDLVAARRQAELASDQKTDFLAKISHEIRTPLNAIIGFSEVMLEERFGKISIDRYREYLRDINRSGSHVLELVNDLLDISKIEAGKLELEFSEVKLNDIIAEGVALTQPQANRDHIIIRTSLSGAVPPVVADPRSLRQIILNLVSNAIKYTKSGGQVIVSTVFEESGEVVLRVRDTGIGMSESEITTAMMPFRRVQSIANQQGEGTGLGLPLTKALVEANRAQFSIESSPGEGTLVEIYFPSTRVLTK